MSFTYNIFDGALAGAITSEPDIKLSEAAMVDNSNVIIEDGEVKTSPLRLLEGEDNNGNQIKIPELSYPIVSVTSSTDTIVFTGTGSGISVTDTIYLMNNSFTEDPSSGGEEVWNDGYYTVSTVIEGGGTTTIVTVEDVLYDSTDGYLFSGITEAINLFSLFSEGSEELFIFTKNNIYQWKIAGMFLDKLTLPYELSGNVEHWSVDQGLINFGTTESPDSEQGLIACNGIDRPLQINSDGTVEVLDAEIDDGGTYISIADHCAFYENYLILGNVTLNTGDVFPRRFYNSDLLDTANFKSNDASFFTTEGPDAIAAFGKNRQYLIIFKEESIIQVYFTGSEDLFQLDRLSTPVGCRSPLSIINDRNNFLYFFGTDKRFKILETGGDISDVIEKTVRNINDTLIPKISGAYVRDDNRLVWSIPVGANATGNNKVVIIKEGIWSFLDIEASVFSVFRKVFTDTWDTVNPNITWDNATDSWDNVQGVRGKLKTLTTDYSGNLSTLFDSNDDLGNSYTSYVTISTDLNKKQSLNLFKRITYIRAYFKPINDNDTISIDVSKDNSSTFTNIASFSAYDADKDLSIIHLPLSLRAKSFRFKIHSTDIFSMIGLIVKFEKSGSR